MENEYRAIGQSAVMLCGCGVEAGLLIPYVDKDVERIYECRPRPL